MKNFLTIALIVMGMASSLTIAQDPLAEKFKDPGGRATPEGTAKCPSEKIGDNGKMTVHGMMHGTECVQVAEVDGQSGLKKDKGKVVFLPGAARLTYKQAKAVGYNPCKERQVLVDGRVYGNECIDPSSSVMVGDGYDRLTVKQIEEHGGGQCPVGKTRTDGRFYGSLCTQNFK